MTNGLNPDEITGAKSTVCKFLSKFGMYHAEIDIQKHVDLFLHEMKEGLAGRKSSLKMFPTYLIFLMLELMVFIFLL